VSIATIGLVDQGQINTRFFSLLTLTFGEFRFRSQGAFGHGTGMIEVPETGQAFSAGLPDAAEEVEVEFYMADEDTLVRFREWVRASRLRLPGYVQPCTAVYLRDSGDPNDVMEIPLTEVWAKGFTGPEASQAEAGLGRITGTLVVSGALLPAP